MAVSDPVSLSRLAPGDGPPAERPVEAPVRVTVTVEYPDGQGTVRFEAEGPLAKSTFGHEVEEEPGLRLLESRRPLPGLRPEEYLVFRLGPATRWTVTTGPTVRVAR